jgi:hypothetical protein
MKPFDLKKAMAGERVMTRCGRQVSEIHYLRTLKTGYPVVAVVEGGLWAFTLGGNFHNDGVESENDLVMAPEKRTVWLNIYPHREVDMYESENNADVFARIGRLGGRAYPLEIEE